MRLQQGAATTGCGCNRVRLQQGAATTGCGCNRVRLQQGAATTGCAYNRVRLQCRVRAKVGATSTGTGTFKTSFLQIFPETSSRQIVLYSICELQRAEVYYNFADRIGQELYISTLSK